MEMTRIRNFSIVLRWSVAVAGIGLVVLALGVILYPPAMVSVIESNFGRISANGLTLSKHVMLSVLALLAVAPSLRALQMLWRLFTAYIEGAVLSETAAAALKSLGRVILVMSIVTVLAPTLAVLILTYDNPPGTKQLAVHISGNTYALLLFGGLITTIGWAMVEAARVDADNKAII